MRAPGGRRPGPVPVRFRESLIDSVSICSTDQAGSGPTDRLWRVHPAMGRHEAPSGLRPDLAFSETSPGLQLVAVGHAETSELQFLEVEAPDLDDAHERAVDGVRTGRERPGAHSKTTLNGTDECRLEIA